MVLDGFIAHRYSDNIAREILGSLLLQNEEDAAKFMKLYGHLPSFEQRNLLYTFLSLLSRDNLSLDITSEDDDKWWQVNTSIVSAAAKLINVLIANNESRKDHLIAWLTSSSGAGIGEGVAIRRAAIVSLSKNKKDIETILEKSLSQFGDTLYIRHASTLQQEGAIFQTIKCYFYTDTIPSTCSSSSSICRLRLQSVASSAYDDYEVRLSFERSFE